MTVDFGRRTRRRPIERDYAAAKDAEVGKRTKDRELLNSEFGMWKAESKETERHGAQGVR